MNYGVFFNLFGNVILIKMIVINFSVKNIERMININLEKV